MLWRLNTKMIFSSPTLFKYVSAKFFINFFVFMFILIGVIFAMDVIELIRKVSDNPDIELTTILTISLMKMPFMAETTMPIGILFSSLYTCWKLNGTSELVVMRSSGLSAWQFLTPLILGALFLGVFTTTVLNPISSVFYSKYEQLESKYVKGDVNLASVSKAGIWLRQSLKDGYALINATKLDPVEWEMKNVTVFFFDNNDDFTKRIESENVRLIDGFWKLENPTINTKLGSSTTVDSITIPTELTSSKIEESFSSPETISYWGMPEYIRIMSDAGLSTTSMRLYFHKLNSRPFLFIALVLLAAIFSLRPLRMGNSAYMIVAGVSIGFAIFFMESFLEAFGLSHKLPVYLAAWSPAIISILIGSTFILHLEDG